MNEKDLRQDNTENYEEETANKNSPASNSQSDAAQEQKEGGESSEKTAEQERDEYLAGWQRAQADLQNLKRQHEQERALFTNVGKEAVLRDLIPMLDNFEAAFSNKEAWEATPESWRVGIEYIYNQFQAVLEKHGVTTYGQIGDAFDAAIHEPVASEPVEDEAQKNTITAVVQKGYKIGDKVVRAAKVKVGE
tara:strand:- start:185 stop:760 length:576 start_codon:yes stop_codon:yes gene_type:complete